MQTKNWQKIENIFFEAVSLPAVERKAFIKEQSAGDEELFSEISLLIENDDREKVFFDEPLFALGARLLSLDNETILKKTEFAQYKLRRVLGRGGSGLVLLAEDTKLDRLVALKVLSENLTENGQFVARFQNEARAASKVAHPSVAHIYEFGRHEDRYFLAMEYVSGRSLRELLKTPVAAADAAEIALQIAFALQAAHKNGVIHRDIKPENIVVTDEGTVKVLDFGLAKLTVADGADTSDAMFETAPGIVMGTVSYMSPEQARGRATDAKTDFWSLGVCLYEMLAGKRPFEGETRSDTMAAILKSDYVPLVLPAKLKDLKIIVARLLQKDAANRYAEASEIIADLQNFQKKNAPEKGRLSLFARRPHIKKEFAGQLKKYKKEIIFNLLISLSAAAVGGAWHYGYLSPPPASAPAPAVIESIAVLPFINESGDGAQDYLTDGMTESLINRLSQLPNLTVKARSSVFRYKNSEYAPQNIGRELSVQAVLVGRVSERDDQLALSLELVDAATGNQIWGERYTQPKSGLIALQNRVTLDVSSKIKNKISGADAQKLAKIYTENTQAYQLYLKGRFYWNKRTGKDLLKAIEYFDQATALDPKFALAYAGLADSYLLLSGYAVSSPRESFPRAKEAAQRALTIDESLAEAHTALSYALFNFDWDFEESEREIKRAIELNPNYSTAYHWYGNANLLATGRMDESIAAMEKARDLDPLSLIINADLATSYLYAEQFDKAIELYQKTISLDENFYYSRIYLGRTYSLKGDYPAAIAELKKAQALDDDPQVQMLLARTYISMGKPAEARKILGVLTELAKKKYVSPYYLAEIHAGLGEKDAAFKWLDKAVEMREGPMIYLKAEPFFRELHDDFRFDNLLVKVGLKQ